MAIVKVEIYPIRVRLDHPVAMASGVISSCDNVLVKFTESDGATGWGEGVSALSVTGESQHHIIDGVARLAGRLIGLDPFDLEALSAVMAKAEARTAVTAIDLALWDLRGHLLGQGIVELLGGARRPLIAGLTLIGTGSRASDVEALIQRLEEGWTWFKLKVGMTAVDEEIATVSQLCELVGDSGVVCADANEGWDETSAHRFVSEAPTGLAFLEQPVSRYDHLALQRLCHASATAICADESAATLDDLPGLADLGVRGVSLKLIKHGGISGVMKGGSSCENLGLEVNLAGKVAETSISAAANLHCAAALPSIGYGCSPANQGLVMDVTETPVTPLRGTFPVPPGAGLGISVDETLVDRLRNGSVETIVEA